MEILARNSLRIREMDLYRAVIKWARALLKRDSKRRTHLAIRAVLGEALFLVRFPTMHLQEFNDGPAKENVLLAEEKLAVYDNVIQQRPKAVRFRRSAAGGRVHTSAASLQAYLLPDMWCSNE
ncbi:hypothetical protein AAVH_19163 [Aphelenchoides avenae]|nr:hypothetical protein AAVH_19163 [Aphelenchus avenae]